MQAFKRRRRDLRSGAISVWHDSIASRAHHSGVEAGEIYGRSGLGGKGVIPNSVALILRRQKGLRRCNGLLEDKQINLSCLREERRPRTR